MSTKEPPPPRAVSIAKSIVRFHAANNEAVSEDMWLLYDWISHRADDESGRLELPPGKLGECTGIEGDRLATATSGLEVLGYMSSGVFYSDTSHVLCRHVIQMAVPPELENMSSADLNAYIEAMKIDS